MEQRSDPNLKAVLAHPYEQLGPLKTHAGKLPYLVDVIAHHALGHCILSGSEIERKAFESTRLT